MNWAEVVLVFVGIPAVVTGTLAGLTFLPGLARRPRYRPGEPWPHEPVFYGPHPAMLDQTLQDLLEGSRVADERPALTARPRPVLTAGPAAVTDTPAATPPEPAQRPVATAKGGAHGDW